MLGTELSKPRPVKCAYGLYAAGTNQHAKGLKSIVGRHGTQPEARELTHGPLITYCHANVSPRSPLHTCGRHAFARGFVGDRIEHRIGSGVVCLATRSQLRRD